MTKIIEFDEQCRPCKGSGIYVGIAERDGIGVVCTQCKGEGVLHTRIEYESFTRRQRRDDVTHVIEVNPGIVCGKTPDFGGMSYESWLDGNPFLPGTEIRNFTCPVSWFQFTDYAKKPGWHKCECGECSHFRYKEKCWAQWDAEQAGAAS